MNKLIVLDTNVIVSAGLSSAGAPAKIVEGALSNELIVVTCPSIVDEYWMVLQRPKFTRFGFPPLWLDALLHFAHHLTHDPPPWPHAGPDPSDLIFLSLASEMGAILISGNIKDYPPSIRDQVTVMTPANYIAALK